MNLDGLSWEGFYELALEVWMNKDHEPPGTERAREDSQVWKLGEDGASKGGKASGTGDPGEEKEALRLKVEGIKPYRILLAMVRSLH